MIAVTPGILVTGALAFLSNVPLGRIRARCRKFSPGWFTAIHASIPVIVGLRLWLAIPWGWAPLFVLLAVVGQVVGGLGGAEGPTGRG